MLGDVSLARSMWLGGFLFYVGKAEERVKEAEGLLAGLSPSEEVSRLSATVQELQAELKALDESSRTSFDPKGEQAKLDALNGKVNGLMEAISSISEPVPSVDSTKESGM